MLNNKKWGTTGIAKYSVNELEEGKKDKTEYTIAAIECMFGLNAWLQLKNTNTQFTLLSHIHSSVIRFLSLAHKL